ncbi:MAG: hypothetical protein O2954_00560 [bacterium]|nr:hypothetical protein [bacterium]
MLSKNQIHKIDLIHEALAKRMEKEHTRRSEHITDVDLSFVDQTTLGEVVVSLSNPCHAYKFRLTPPGGICLIDYALPIRNEFLKFVGLPKTEGLVTSDERTAMSKIVRKDLADLETAWAPVEKMRVTEAVIEEDREQLNYPTPQGVLLVAFECNMQHASGLIRFVYSLADLDGPVLEKLDAWTPA